MKLELGLDFVKKKINIKSNYEQFDGFNYIALPASM